MVLMAYNTLYVAPSIMETLPADHIDQPEKPGNNNPNLLPEKIETTDFDADANLTLTDANGNSFADLEYSKGMIITSERIQRSSSGKEAIVEYVNEMEDVFFDVGASWTSDSYVKLAGKSTHISIDDAGRYNVYMKKVNGNTEGTNLWLNFIAYVTNKDVARAVYGICVEKITLGNLNPMPAELVAKYGGTLVSDIVESDIEHFATISIGGYSIGISYTASERHDVSVRDGIPTYLIVI